jgi:hypothetical protein
MPCPATTTLNVLISSFDILANACSSLDKLFWNFSYTPIGPLAPAANQVTADVIANPNINGWNFSSLWLSIGGASAAFTLSYSIEVCPASAPPPCNAPPAGTRIVTADAVYAPSSQFPPGSETVSWIGGLPSPANVTLTAGSPGPMPTMFSGGFLGPINVTANFSGGGAITQTTTRFYESAIPESATMTLLGIGLAGLGIIRRRRCS